MVPVYVKKISRRQFKAAVKFQGGWVVSDPAPQRRGAIKLLEQRLQELGANIPEWDVREAKAELEAKAKPEAKPEPEALASGWATPLSAPERWAESARAALALADKMDLSALGPRDRNNSLRGVVNALMESTGSIGAFRVRPDGRTWISLSEIQDPTVRGVKPGEGERRVYTSLSGVLKDSNGNPLESKKESAKKSAKKDPFLAEVSRRAYKAGAACSAFAKAHGKDSNLAYKVGQVVIRRSMGAPPHPKFEADLASNGISEDWISEKGDIFVNRAEAWLAKTKESRAA